MRDLILGVVTRSANDAAAVMAEELGGSEADFAALHDLEGAPARHAADAGSERLRACPTRSSARRRATSPGWRSRCITHFPREYRYFSIQEFEFRGEHDPHATTISRMVRGCRRHQDRVCQRLRVQPRRIGGAQRASADRRDNGRPFGAAAATCRWPRCSTRGSRRSETASRRRRAQTLVAAAPTAYPKASSSNSIAASAAPATAPARAAPALAARVVTAPAVAAAEEDDDDDEASDTDDRKAGALSRAASAALRHLAPVSKAQAAPAVHVKTEAEDGWGIQLGAYRDQSAARQALQRLAGVAVVNGKPQQVLAPPKSDRRGLYRVRLLRFNESGARAACTALKKRKIECTVVRSAMKVARS